MASGNNSYSGQLKRGKSKRKISVSIYKKPAFWKMKMFPEQRNQENPERQNHFVRNNWKMAQNG